MYHTVKRYGDRKEFSELLNMSAAATVTEVQTVGLLWPHTRRNVSKYLYIIVIMYEFYLYTYNKRHGNVLL